MQSRKQGLIWKKTCMNCKIKLGGWRDNNHKDQNGKKLVSNEIRLQGLRVQSWVSGKTKSWMSNISPHITNNQQQ